MTDLARIDDRVIVGADTLAYLGLDPKRPEVHALVLLCQRYQLDPLLNHASIIVTRKGGPKAYITRDGMLDIAHRSGQLDGIVVDDEHQTENGGYSATVSIWRKDMAHPFTYRGGCGHAESQAEQGNGAEMALARAERRALRRAFAIPAYDGADEAGRDLDYETGEIVPQQVPASSPPSPPVQPPERSDKPSPRAARPPAATPKRAAEPTIGIVDKHTTGGPPLPTVWRDGTPMFDPQTGKPVT